MKIPNQKKVWNEIATPWKEMKTKPDMEVIEFLKNKKGEGLDLGCGSGRNFIKSKDYKLYGIDFSSEMLKFAKKYADKEKISVELKLMKNETIPYPKSYFDSAVFIRTLHYKQTKSKREKILKELKRVLKPNSQALITIWSRNNKRIKNKPSECLVPWTKDNRKYQRYTYIYDKQELQTLLKKIGFKVLDSYEDQNLVFVVSS